MVRFKNRYLLVELAPFQSQNTASITQKPAKKARLTDLLAEKEPEESTSPSRIDPLNDAALFKGLSSSNAASHIRQSIEANFGIHAAALNAQSFSVKYCNTRTGTILVRAARDNIQMVWASLTFLTGLPSDCSAKDDKSFKCAWRVVHISGTIRSAQKNAIRRAAKRIKKILDTCTDEAKRKSLQDILKDAEKAVSAIEA